MVMKLDQLKAFPVVKPPRQTSVAIAGAAAAGGVSIQQQQQHQQYLGDMSAALPDFGQISLHTDQLPSGLTADHVSVFEKMYRDHCEVCTKLSCSTV
jgi:hypothetical protein